MEKRSRIDQASTSELYGWVQAVPQAETAPFHSKSPYTVAKLYAYWITVNYLQNSVITPYTSSVIKKVIAFLEKPSLKKANAYLNSGKYIWNAGIFIWSRKTINKAFQMCSVEIDGVFNQAKVFYNTNKELNFIAEYYPKSPNISTDYTLLEKADNLCTIPADIGWSDFGTWVSLHCVEKKYNEKNVISL